MMEKIIDIINNHEEIDKDAVDIIDVDRDGNCYYRNLSLYFTNDESYFNFFSEQIHLAAKNNINELKDFFIPEAADPVIIKTKLDGYINKIKEDKFFAGNLEIYLTTKIFNINIAIYEREYNNENFKQYSQFIPESLSKEVLIINFEGRSHYNLLKLKEQTKDLKDYENNIKDIKNNQFINHNINKSQKAEFVTNVKENKIISQYINVGDNDYYYDYLFRYLISLENAKYKNRDNEIKINWKLVIYPDDLINDNMIQSTKDKKRYNYRVKARNYLIENNTLYFTGFAGKKNCKLRVPFLTEKKNIISNAHINTGHLGINRTMEKIKENGFFWECLIDDVKSYINNCVKYLQIKNGKDIKLKPKVFITKGPLERVVADGWELDEDLKKITGYTWIIDIIDHFSKFLISIPVKNNNADNILFCIKQYCNYLGKPKIFQSDNGTEYKNTIINNFLTTNNIKHIYSSPRHHQYNGVVEVVHKEVRKNIFYNINKINNDIDFKNILLDCVEIHNNNIHTVTGFKPSFLINNQDQEIYDLVIDNIKKTNKIIQEEEKEYLLLKEGDHLLTKTGPYKVGKSIKCRKTKLKTDKLPLTIIKNFICGIIKVKVDVDLYMFKKDETYYIDPKYSTIITENEWKKIIDEITKDNEDYLKNLEKSKKAKKKI